MLILLSIDLSEASLSSSRARRRSDSSLYWYILYWYILYWYMDNRPSDEEIPPTNATESVSSFTDIGKITETCALCLPICVAGILFRNKLFVPRQVSSNCVGGMASR